MWIDGTVRGAHRVAYALRNPLPPGSLKHESWSAEIHHICENRLCVEPSHLVLTTRRDHNAEHKALRDQTALSMAA